MPDLACLKVCFVAGTLGQGGAERQLYYILRELVRHGANARVLCLTEGEFWEKRIRELGVSVTWVGQTHSKARRVAAIVRELRRDRPDVLQSQHFYTNLYTVAAARMLGIPEVGALRSDGINEVSSNSLLLGRLSLRVPRLVAANSRTGIANAMAFGVPAERMVLLPNVVDTSRFLGCAAAQGERVRILTAGRLVDAKRFDRFLRVLADVRRRAAQPVEAVLVGDGPNRDALHAQAAAMGLGPDCLTFAGAASSMVEHYQAADLFVLTSDWEGTPNVVLEAMASGLPVVATRVGGIEDIVPEGAAGSLFDPWDERGLADAVLQLASCPSMRREWGRSGRAHVERSYAVAGLARQLASLYARVLPAGQRRQPSPAEPVVA